MVEVLREGYKIPFVSLPPLSSTPINLPSYSPSSIKGKALRHELLALQEKGAVQLAPPTPGYYSRMFVVQKASGSWRPIIDLSVLNHHVEFTPFHMETPQSVLRAVRHGDWMISLDLADAYLQVPIAEESRKYLRFVTSEGVFQFQVLCFGLTTAPQVFSRVMAPVSVMMHRRGYRMLRYLDDWLVLGSSLTEVLAARDYLLYLCQSLGIQINLEKSSLQPAQKIDYLGMTILSSASRVFPTQKRISQFLSQLEEFLSVRVHPVSLWRSLLGRMSSLSLLVPGSRLRTRSLQFCLRSQWDQKNEEAQICWDDSCLSDLQWWSDLDNLTPGVPLEIPIPDLLLYSDASDQGWGACLGDNLVSGLWSQEDKLQSINFRELKAILLSIRHFLPKVQGSSLGVFSDNTTAVAYLRKEGGTKSWSLNSLAQTILRECELHQIRLLPQFVSGSLNAVADALSRKNQVLGSEWTLCSQVVSDLTRRWPAMIDLFATNLNFRLPIYYSPVRDPMSAGTDAMLQTWDQSQSYAFPPFGMIVLVLNKLRQSHQAEMTLIAPF